MITFNYKESTQIPNSELQKHAYNLKPYIQELNYVAKEAGFNHEASFINTPFDETALSEILHLKDLMSGELKTVLIIGIGGANLGSKALYDIFYGYYDILDSERIPKAIFLDTNNPEFMFKLEKYLRKYTHRPEEILVNVISKSGKTTETIHNLNFFTENFPLLKNRIVITTEKDTDFYYIAKKENYPVLLTKSLIGDRFGVFSYEGLFPLSCLGFNVLDFLKGAMEAVKMCLTSDIEKNTALISAVLDFAYYKKGNIALNSFFFDTRFETLGKWWRQLIAESLGKDGKGIIPLVSLGSIDLHSQLQLYIDGPKNIFTHFVSVEKYKEDIKLTKDFPASALIKEILESVKESYSNNNLPFVETIITKIDLKNLGVFMMSKMFETLFLAKLLDINPFGQPGVENYKKRPV